MYHITLQKEEAGKKLGDMKLVDGFVADGLTDVYNRAHMGVCAEKCAREMNFSREQQDAFVESYERSTAAWAAGKFADEVVPVPVPQKRGDDILVTEDEEYKNVKMEKFNFTPCFWTKRAQLLLPMLLL